MFKAEGIEMDSVSRDILLRKLYETCYGIHDHYGPNQKPLALVTARQKEETFLYSKKAVDYQRFIDLGIASATGMSLNEFFEMTVPEIELIFSLVEHSNKVEGQSGAALEKKLKQAMEAEAARATKENAQ